jgi:hypothetical protein
MNKTIGHVRTFLSEIKRHKFELCEWKKVVAISKRLVEDKRETQRYLNALFWSLVYYSSPYHFPFIFSAQGKWTRSKLNKLVLRMEIKNSKCRQQKIIKKCKQNLMERVQNERVVTKSLINS